MVVAQHKWRDGAILLEPDSNCAHHRSPFAHLFVVWTLRQCGVVVAQVKRRDGAILLEAEIALTIAHHLLIFLFSGH